MEKRSQWKFDIAEAGWTWTAVHPDGSTAAADKHWSTLKDCVDDAAVHGYVAWKPEAERRRDQILKVTEILKRES